MNGFRHTKIEFKQSFKQPGERSGFPGKTYEPLSFIFGGKLSSTATGSTLRLFVAWVALAGIKPIIILLLFKLRSVYTHY